MGHRVVLLLLVDWGKCKAGLLLVGLDGVLEEDILIEKLGFMFLELKIFSLKFLDPDEHLFHHLFLEFVVFLKLQQFSDLCLDLLRVDACDFLVGKQ